MTLRELNEKDLSGFVAALGWIFEASPWVAALAWEKRPFATLDALHSAMTAVVIAATEAQQVALLRAHPDLGAVRLKPDTTDDVRLRADPLKPNGTGSVRLQADPHMSDASQREQAGAGLDTLTREELQRMQDLNAAYREKFGFPFLYAVKGSTKEDILGALERRLTSSRDIEHQEALRQVFRIARFRLEDTVKP
jgi:2-oxo-4-hydroxy-4-carboxy--5-ureidoimidazoline (OHCU) decarboxylase